MRRSVVACLILAGTALPRLTRAEPQATLGLKVGGALESAVGPDPSSGAFALGGRADVLFLASGPGQNAVGPYVDVTTLGFRDVNASGGAEWAIPATADFPLVLGAGAFARTGSGGVQPGLDGSLFFGPRSYNFHSWYELTAGAFAETLWIPASGTVDVVVGAQIDAELLALPFLLAFEAVRH